MKALRTLSLGLALAALCPVMSFAQDLSPYTLTDNTKQTLVQGDVFTRVWRDKTRDDKAVDVFGAIDINASAETIWNVMLDCPRNVKMVKDMKSCKVLETSPDGNWDIREQKIRVSVLLPKTRSVFRSDYITYQEIRIRKEAGDMKIQDGLWKLTPLANGKTRLTYRAAMQPNFPAPKSFIRKGMKKEIPNVLKNLRKESESDQRKADQLTSSL